jgi:2-polyprenyl-6-hydroxyphenyl methylase/3-demethylubiquinone-9 3-methyltransferase
MTAGARSNIPNRMPKTAAYTLAQRSNFLGLTAALYDTWRVRSLPLLTGEAFTLEREFALMVNWLHLQPATRALDVGTSTGNYARVLAAHGVHVTAIDISKPMLERARTQTDSALSVNYEQANVEALPYADSSFDAVVVGASLNEFHSTATALAEMARVLKPDGKLFMMYLREADNALGRFTQSLFRLGGVRFPNRSRVAQTLERHGVYRTRAELRRAVTLELFVKSTPVQRDEPVPRGLERAAGKPARHVLGVE